MKKTSLDTIKEGFYYEEIPHSHPVKGKKKKILAIRKDGENE